MIAVTKKVEYAVALVHFLSKNRGNFVKLRRVADQTGLPYKFLGQIAVNLKTEKWLKSLEGKNGGYQLDKGWERKSLYDLIVALGEDRPVVECLGGVKCLREEGCFLRKMWKKVEEGFVIELKKIKLREI